MSIRFGKGARWCKRFGSVKGRGGASGLFGKGARRCKRFGSGWMVCAGRKGKAVLDVLDEFTGAFDGAPVIGIEV